MAKKAVIEESKEVSVEDRLSALYQLQIVATRIDRIRTIRGELPLEVQELEDELEGRRTRYAKYEEEIKRIDAVAKDNKALIKEASALVERYAEQLNEIRNNREYDALTKEIEYQNLNIQGYEKAIREGKERTQYLQEELGIMAEEMKEREKDLLLKQKELEEIVAETKEDEDALKKIAKQLEEKIDERELISFKRTRKSSLNGLAVVAVQQDACTGCYNKIPPQRVIDVAARRKVIDCEYCGRVLVDTELAHQAEIALDLPNDYSEEGAVDA